jgi:peptidoglycan biosynthesis protein MviN/MurJ (putative lipid II flippase)
MTWLLQVTLATIAMGLALTWQMPDVSLWQSLHWWQRGIDLGVLCVSGFVVFVATLWLAGARPSDLRR